VEDAREQERVRYERPHRIPLERRAWSTV
jgi:hypothetical protein